MSSSNVTPSFSLLELHKHYDFAQTCFIIEHVPEPELRRYTHVIERKYLPPTSVSKRKRYVTEDEYQNKLTLNEQRKTCVERYEFTLHPLLRDDYFSQLSLDDLEQTIHSCPDREIWLLMLIENQAIRPCALAPFNSSFSDLVECEGKTIGYNKMIEIYSHKMMNNISPFRVCPSRCLVSNKDEEHIGPMLVYQTNNVQTLQLLSDVYAMPNLSIDFPLVLDELCTKIESSFQTRVYPNVSVWQRTHMLPKEVIVFDLVRKEICDQAFKEKRGNKTAVLHIMAVIPQQEYNAQFGTPINLLEEPFRFVIETKGMNEIYNDFFNFGFYVSNPILEDILKHIESKNPRTKK